MKILFIQTGGTIDKDYPKLTKGYAFEITMPATQRILEDINPFFDFEILELLQKDSLDITDEDREKIRGACLGATADKIIITHGTDTMIETATNLADIKNKAIILTGAMRPERFSNSDADFNVGVAIGAINMVKEGIYIAMNGRVYQYDKVKRDLTTGQFVEI
ncbi:asparaginase [Patescibacteria group bacterium]|nr:asparaginase [Patescibacteria group bacterium]MBU1783484.1 asparaginase [Patescibacteria group bacterium]MBU2081315.1 asparaginase [Patescibacteria group bacterium]MBU2214658.1 asparaginase [Patescibacteria group bacterium]MBU2250223.1 asparaginase [Patescibacteria group bacterium]